MSDPALIIDDLRAAFARLQDLADARLYRARAARITLESVGIPGSEPVDVSAARAAGMIEDLRAEVARLTSELAAAQSERDRLRATLDSALCMVVEGPDAVGSREACRSAAKILSDGLSAQTGRTPIAPHLVRLHQAYEGTTVCLHCGEPMPWSEMEVCPRVPKDLRA